VALSFPKSHSNVELSTEEVEWIGSSTEIALLDIKQENVQKLFDEKVRRFLLEF